ncbi:MAG: glycosyltransferase family 9 protein [Bdellovibrio sp.]
MSFAKDLAWAEVVHGISKRGPSNRARLREKLKAVQFDQVFAPHRSWTSRFLSRSLKPRQSIGFDFFGSSLFFNLAVPDLPNWPEALRILSLLQIFDPKWSFSNLRDMNLNQPSLWHQHRHSFACTLPRRERRDFSHGSCRVAIFPGSQWEGKKWPAGHFLRLGRKLHSEGFQVVFFGGGQEVDFQDQLQREWPEAESWIGKISLVQTFQKLREFDLVLSNDSAGQHLGALAGCGVVSLFGPTVLGLGFRPWTELWRPMELSLPCRPCNPHGPRACPLGTHACLRNLSVEQVLFEIRSFSKEL